MRQFHGCVSPYYTCNDGDSPRLCERGILDDSQRVVSKEEGKTIRESRGETQRAIETLELSAEESCASLMLVDIEYCELKIRFVNFPENCSIIEISFFKRFRFLCQTFSKSKDIIIVSPNI